MRYPEPLLKSLSDGALHSGTALAQRLGITRAAVSKQARSLAELGVAIEAVRGRGYRLAAPLECLVATNIRASLGAKAAARVRRLEVVPLAASTNSTLLERGPPPSGAVDVLIAEYQTGGRGRRGRAWVAPFGSSLLLSLGVAYCESRSDLSGVTLAIGVALVRALSRAGLGKLSLKWPNDVEVDGEKLAGVLCELRVEAGGPAHVVIGVGLNFALPPATVAALAAAGRRVTDVRRCDPRAPDRSALAALLIDELVAAVDEFGHTGLVSFIDEWRSADALKDRTVSVETAGRSRAGTARGITAEGALLVDFAGALERIDAGDVTLRPIP